MTRLIVCFSLLAMVALGCGDSTEPIQEDGALREDGARDGGVEAGMDVLVRLDSEAPRPEDVPPGKDMEPLDRAVQVDAPIPGDLAVGDDASPDDLAVGHDAPTGDGPSWDLASPDGPLSDGPTADGIFHHDLPDDSSPCCRTAADCPAGWRCEPLTETCLPPPDPDRCWTDQDCPSPGEICTNERLCPCDGACEDQPGQCTDMLGQGCCREVGDCRPGHPGEEMICLHTPQELEPGWGVCHSRPEEPGWCWRDEDCGPGQECHGEAICPCLMDCDMDYEGPGVCVPQGEACAPIDPAWVKEICDAANVVIFDGEICRETCPGCCGCHPFCDLTFPTMEDCRSACGEGQCRTYIAALADCPFGWSTGNFPGDCPVASCRPEPCRADQDCPEAAGAQLGPHCVAGNCSYCWEDPQCPEGSLCRAGRCVVEPPSCPDAPPCTDLGCHLVTPSEAPCPVCVCDSIFNIACRQDTDCLILSSHPYSHCVNGRCAECRFDRECGHGLSCLAPGLCFTMEPGPEGMYGTWLMGWAGGINHFSYLRFEPDGTLRRGSYQGSDTWADDIPPLPCQPPGGVPSPLVGTWEPEVTASGFLAVRMSLNLSCHSGDGWRGRYMVTLAGQEASFQDIDGGQDMTGLMVPAEACSPDMRVCDAPGP